VALEIFVDHEIKKCQLVTKKTRELKLR